MLSTGDKLSIIRSIIDERELRLEVLIPILRQIPGVIKVIDTHGADEQGKDIVTLEHDALGAPFLTAFVVKAKKFSRAATQRPDTELLANVGVQVQMAVTSGFIWPEIDARQARPFGKIVIVTSQSLSHSTREYLRQMVSMYANVTFQFFDETDLMRLVDQYLPDLYYTRNGALASYFKRLSARCTKLNEHERIQIYRGEIRDVEDVYVPPKLHRISRKVKNGSPVSSLVTSEPEIVIQQRKHLLIVAGPGGGKSTMLRALALDSISGNRRTGVTVVPVLVKAHELIRRLADGELDGALQEVVTEEFGSDAPKVSDLAASGSYSIRLLIDGLDEIPVVDDQLKLCALISEHIAKYPAVKVAITTRYANQDVVAALSGGFYRWDLVWWYRGIIRRFAGKWFKDKADQEQFMATLYEHDLMSRLPTTPLVLTMLAILYDFGETDLPGSLPELYQMISDLLLGKWSLERRAATFYKANQKEFLLSTLAFEMHMSRRTSLEIDALRILVGQVGSQLGEPFDFDTLIHELTDISGLLRITEKGSVEFRHLSFQEFFAAKHIDVQELDDAHAYLAGLFGDSWMSRIVYYYAGMKKADAGLLRRLRSTISDAPDSQAARMIIDLGYILQASYLTPIDMRLETLAEQIVTFGRFLSYAIDKLELPEGFPAWVMVMVLVRMFVSTYRSSHWHDREAKIAEMVEREAPGTTLSDLTSRLLSALIIDDDLACAEALISLEPMIRTIPVLYVCLDSEIATRLSSDDDPKALATQSNLAKIQQEVRRRMEMDPQFFGDAFQDRRVRQLAAAANRNTEKA